LLDFVKNLFVCLIIILSYNRKGIKKSKKKGN